MAFGDVLKAELEKAGMTAYRLSQLTGISQATLSRTLAGDGSPSWDTVQKICAALGVPCTAFQAAGVELPTAGEGRGRGRPKKADAEGEAGEPAAEAGRGEERKKPPAKRKGK